jgi:hypothetical protein
MHCGGGHQVPCRPNFALHQPQRAARAAALVEPYFVKLAAEQCLFGRIGREQRFADSPPKEIDP